jgi:predicted metal-dependent peptidase
MLAIGKQLTTEQRLSKAVVDIMGNPKYVALAGILMIGDKRICDTTPTAYTNGRDEVYGREFVDKLNDAEFRFLILHECYHKLYRHLTTWHHLYKENPQLANVACDYVINLKIADDNKNDGFATMTGALTVGCYDEQYRGMDSAQVYEMLKQKQQQQQASGDSTTGTGNPGPGTGNGSSSNSLPQGFDEHDWEGAQELSADEQRELARDIDEAIRQGALIAGKMGTGGDRDLAELLEPQVNWREVMRDFIQTTCSGSDYSTWQRPSRRYIGMGHYLPSGISEAIGELVIAGDMSGSIGQREISVILTETKEICDTVHPDKVRMLYWDTQVCQDEEYDQHELDDLVKSTKPAGGGGTSVECVPEYITAKGIKPQAVVVITDGYLGGSWGQWSCPVLWVIIDNKSAKPDVGVAVHVKSGDM